MLTDSPEGMKGEAKTPVADFLFDVNPDAEKLEEDPAYTFLTLTTTLIYLCKRARPDT